MTSTEEIDYKTVHATPFDSLPNQRKVWNGPPGSREEGLGRLILLTPDVVKEAATSCIKTGRRITVGWTMDKLDVANFNRHPAQHFIVPIFGGMAYDDVYIFNPQQSSQWDGLRHFSAPFPEEGNKEKRLFYGGMEGSEIMNRSNMRIGMQHWAREGICGRGVLLDYAAYAKRHSIKYSNFSDHSAPLSTLLSVAKEQNVAFKRGDILFIRFGLAKEWDSQMSSMEKLEYARNPAPQHAGIEGTKEMLRWIWDEGFSAVASDTVSFEVFPPQKSFARGHGEPEVEGVSLHEYLLAGWGMPIGELFDLEELGRICEEEKRWEFFVASSPLNMPGGVSSPPNCIAIF